MSSSLEFTENGLSLLHMNYQSCMTGNSLQLEFHPLQ